MIIIAFKPIIVQVVFYVSYIVMIIYKENYTYDFVCVDYTVFLEPVEGFTFYYKVCSVPDDD